MMSTAGTTGELHIHSPGSPQEKALPGDGSVVRVEVRGVLPGGNLSVRVAGRIWSAGGFRGFRAGDTFSARIQISGSSVFLHPVGRFSGDRVFDALRATGLPATPESLFLVQFCRTIEIRLDPKLLGMVSRIASRFPGREKRAAEAAVILAERGIAPDDASVARLLSCMEGWSLPGGDAGGGDSGAAPGDEDFLAFVNRKKGENRHWIVLPFRKEFAGMPFSGSVRFLLDLAASRTLQTRMTISGDGRCWDFTLDDGTCLFSASPPFAPVVFNKFVVYLSSVLGNSGISRVEYAEAGCVPECRTVDMEW